MRGEPPAGVSADWQYTASGACGRMVRGARKNNHRAIGSLSPLPMRPVVVLAEPLPICRPDSLSPLPGWPVQLQVRHPTNSSGGAKREKNRHAIVRTAESLHFL